MNWSEGTAIVLGLFVLRLGVPLAITLLISALLRRVLSNK